MWKYLTSDKYDEFLSSFNLIDYYKVINNDYSNIFNISSYNEAEKQIDIMLNNDIVVSSLSYILNQLDFVKGIDMVSSYKMCLNNNKMINIKVINKKEGKYVAGIIRIFGGWLIWILDLIFMIKDNKIFRLLNL